LANHFAAISPNLIELQTVLSLPRSEETQEDVVHAAEIFHRKLREAHADAAPALVLRAGALGSYTIATGWKGWVPAYWRPTEQNRVVDVTGGGNAFLGGLCAGLLASDGDYRIGW
jgi:sugar/nucleoside kinase (ribokinase family)